MSKSIDALLRDRFQYFKLLSKLKVEDAPEKKMLMKSVQQAISEIDIELVRESAGSVAIEDIENAKHALDKAALTGDWNAAKVEYLFYQVRGIYRFLLRQSGLPEAERYLKTQIPGIGKAYAVAISAGSIPAEFD